MILYTCEGEIRTQTKKLKKLKKCLTSQAARVIIRVQKRWVNKITREDFQKFIEELKRICFEGE